MRVSTHHLMFVLIPVRGDPDGSGQATHRGDLTYYYGHEPRRRNKATLNRCHDACPHASLLLLLEKVAWGHATWHSFIADTNQGGGDHNNIVIYLRTRTKAVDTNQGSRHEPRRGQLLTTCGARPRADRKKNLLHFCFHI